MTSSTRIKSATDKEERLYPIVFRLNCKHFTCSKYRHTVKAAEVRKDMPVTLNTWLDGALTDIITCTCREFSVLCGTASSQSRVRVLNTSAAKESFEQRDD